MSDFNSPGTYYPQSSYERRFGKAHSTKEKYGLSESQLCKRSSHWISEHARIKEIAVTEFDALDVNLERHVRESEMEEHATVTGLTVILHDEQTKQLSDQELRSTIDAFLQRLNEENLTYLNTFEYKGAELRTETWDSFLIEVPDFLDPRE